MPHFTPTEQRLLAALSDGKPKLRTELVALLGDELSVRQCMSSHIGRMRKKLLPLGQTIFCTIAYRRCYYVHVRLLNDVNS